MGELVTLPDGRQYRLPAGISSEERASILLELRSLFGIAGDYVPNAGISGQPTNLSEEQAGLPEDLEALEEIIRSKNQSLEDLEGTNTGLLERLQTTYGGVTKKDRYLEYIRRQREVVSDNVGLLSQTDRKSVV